jgi:hypothetical protein
MVRGSAGGGNSRTGCGSRLVAAAATPVEDRTHFTSPQYFRQVGDRRPPNGCPEAHTVKCGWVGSNVLPGLEDWRRGVGGRDGRTALLEQAGAFKDDETLPALRAAIYAARGRPEVPEEPRA